MGNCIMLNGKVYVNIRLVYCFYRKFIVNLNDDDFNKILLCCGKGINLMAFLSLIQNLNC